VVLFKDIGLSADKEGSMYACRALSLHPKFIIVSVRITENSPKILMARVSWKRLAAAATKAAEVKGNQGA
jgi:hypothetical protein